MFNPGQCDRVLLAAQEPLGAVNRIERPIGGGRPVVVALVDGGQNLLG